MIEFADGGFQTTANFPERVSGAHLAKQHGDELIPTAETLGMFLRAVFMNNPRKY
jgi:hypothetical protein